MGYSALPQKVVSVRAEAGCIGVERSGGNQNATGAVSEKSAPAGRRFRTKRQLQVNHRREYRYGEYQDQPFDVVASQCSGEMHDQHGDGDDVVDDE